LSSGPKLSRKNSASSKKSVSSGGGGGVVAGIMGIGGGSKSASKGGSTKGSKAGSAKGSTAGDSALESKYGIYGKMAVGKGATSVVRLAHKWDRTEEKLYAVKVGVRFSSLSDLLSFLPVLWVVVH
jgi:protein-serine/threonine kinase